MLEILIALILSPTVSALIAYKISKHDNQPLLVLQRTVTSAVKQFGEDEDFEYDEKEYGNFTNTVYEIFCDPHAAENTVEFVKTQQALIAAFTRMKLVSRYGIGKTKVLPALHNLSHVTNSREYATAISAVLSLSFAMINILELMKDVKSNG